MSTALEVGAGYGACTDVLSKTVARPTSVEIDDELAALLRERFADVASVEIVNADTASLPYDDQSLTGAACFTMLHHVRSIDLQDRLFSEVARQRTARTGLTGERARIAEFPRRVADRRARSRG